MAWQSNPQEFRRLIPSFVWVMCSFAVSTLLLISHYVVVKRFPGSRSLLWALAGAVLGAALVRFAGRGRQEHWVYRTLYPIPTDRNSIGWVVFGVLIMAAIACLDLPFDWAHAKDILDHHGSFFDWILGSLTVVGIWLTYNTITESQSIIRSFTQLQSRIVALAEDTLKDKSADDLRVLAYTASIGFLALKRSEWVKIRAAFDKLDERLKVICLDDDDLNSWHNQYIGRKTSRQPEGGGEVLGLKDTWDATKASRHVVDVSAVDIHGSDGEDEGHRKLKSEMMPGYYLIFNSRRAIIITPFFVPQYPLALGKQTALETANRVQMFGFETTDHRIIEDSKTLFDYYWEKSESSIPLFHTEGGSVETLSAALEEKLKQWSKATGSDGKYYRSRTIVIEEQPWCGILSYLRSRVSKEEYRLYLDKTEARVENGKLKVCVADANQAQWIESRCREDIKFASEKLHVDMDVEIVAAAAMAAGV